MDVAVDWARRVPFEVLARIYPGEYGAGVDRDPPAGAF
jgi:hypothetical protein